MFSFVLKLHEKYIWPTTPEKDNPKPIAAFHLGSE